MSDSKQSFTPGPWAFGADGEKIITDYRDVHGNMTDDNWLKGGWAKSVAVIRYGGWMADEEARANGRLISASPSLYEYVSKKASEGDEDAARIIANI